MQETAPVHLVYVNILSSQCPICQAGGKFTVSQSHCSLPHPAVPSRIVQSPGVTCASRAVGRAGRTCCQGAVGTSGRPGNSAPTPLSSQVSPGSAWLPAAQQQLEPTLLFVEPTALSLLFQPENFSGVWEKLPPTTDQAFLEPSFHLPPGGTSAAPSLTLPHCPAAPQQTGPLDARGRRGSNNNLQVNSLSCSTLFSNLLQGKEVQNLLQCVQLRREK